MTKPDFCTYIIMKGKKLPHKNLICNGVGGVGRNSKTLGFFFLARKKFKFGLSGWFFGNSKIP
jgi:hypothetical protein